MGAEPEVNVWIQRETNAEIHAKINDEKYAETNEWLTVANAAKFLGVSKQAIRQRIYRNTIPHRKDADGNVYVRITEHNPENYDKTNGDSYAETLGITESVNYELVDELKDRISFLEHQLENEQRAHAELRRIIAGLVQRVPELEPVPEPRESPDTAPNLHSSVETLKGTMRARRRQNRHGGGDCWGSKD